MNDPTWVTQFVRPICIYIFIAGTVTMLDVSKSADKVAPVSHAREHQNNLPTEDVRNDVRTSRGAAAQLQDAAPAPTTSMSDIGQQSPSNDDLTASPEKNGTSTEHPGGAQTPSSDQTPTATVSTAASPNRYDELIDQVISAHNHGDQSALDAAISRIDAVPKPQAGDPQGATKLNRAGLVALKSRNYVEAAKLFAEAVQTDPSDPKFSSNLGFAEMNAGDLSSAERHVRTSLSLAPRRSVAWGDLALILAKKGDQARSVGCFLIGYKVSEGKTLVYLQSLQDDDDPSVRSAGSIALTKVQSQANRE